MPRRRRTEEPPAPEPAPRPWLGRLAFTAGALLLGVGLFVAGLIVLGQHAQEQLRDRYTLPFAAIECVPPPPYQPRANFLEEVQYLARLPDRVRLLDPELGKQLAAGFGQHPWVRSVERVEVMPQAVRVRLVYRRPVLAVPHGEHVRVVDGEGILLPKAAPAEGLSVFRGNARGPAGPAGTRWGDAAVEEAARRADQRGGSR